MFHVTILNEGNNISGSLEVDSYFFEPSNYEYAFYLYKDDEVVERIKYSENMNIHFILKPKSGDFFIRAFIRDKRDQSKRGFNSEKVTVFNKNI